MKFKLLLLFCLFAMTVRGQLPAIDITKGAFSCRGSYLSFTQYQGRDKEPAYQLGLNTITRRGNGIRLFTFAAIENGAEVAAEISADPSRLRISTAHGHALICFQGPDIIRIQLTNMTLRLKPPVEPRLMPIAANRWRYYSDWTERFLITAHQGTLKSLPAIPDKPQNVYSEAVFDLTPDTGGRADLELEYYLSQANPKPSSPAFNDCMKESASSYTKWLVSMPSVPQKYQPALAQAAWVNWSSIVHPRGNLKREGMIMSKLWMNAIWSWDHCFNAMATAYSNPQLAFDQLMVVFDHQNELGALPDDVYEYRLGWGYLKPPIHGWVLKCMMEKSKAVTPAMLAKIYPYLVKWTDFYFKYRDDNNNGLAETQHGNDSGADNATIFDEGMPVDDPALNTYLVIQMDVLSDIAAKLGKPAEAKQWKARSGSLYKLLMSNLWDGKQFLFRRVIDGKPNQGPFCFMRALPLMLGKRLPAEVRQQLISFIRDTLVSPYGIATEGTMSPKYSKESYIYWRGAIWAPTVYMLLDALEQCGEKQLVRDLAGKFCDMCSKEGFAENFNPLDGKGLCDPAYTWTSSVFILLAHEYLDDTGNSAGR